MSGDAENGDGDREAIYAAFADRDSDFGRSVDEALDRLRERLGVATGALMRIEEGVQTVERVVGDDSLLSPGEQCPLEEAYCQRTVEVALPVSTQQATSSADISAAAYERFELQTYIGCRVEVDGEPFGTVCFVDTDVREDPFDETERLLVELVAQLIGQRIEQRRFERELRERNERLRTQRDRFEDIAEQSFDIIYRLDRTGTFTYVSSAVERVLGYEPETFLGERFSDFLDEESLDTAMEAFTSVLAGESVRGIELSFEDGTGERVWLEVNATAIETDGDVTEIQGVARDVTERRARAEELRLKDRAIDDAGVGVSIADLDADDQPLIYVNEAFTEITGYDRAQAVGRNCRYLQGPGTEAEAVERIREAIDGRESVAVELLNYRLDGAPFWNSLRLRPVADDAGTVTHYVGIQEDVTERKRREQLVHVLNRVLRHNLRNDMNVLLGYGEGLREGRIDPREAGETLTGRVTDLLALSERAQELEEYAREDRRAERLDLEAVLARIRDHHREAFPESDVTVEATTDRDLCVGREVEAALAELVNNGLTHADGPNRVHVSARDDGEWVELRVRDDGPGIPEIEARAVRTSEVSSTDHGDGLGLWLVNWTVTRYGGSFDIEAVEDGGTVATVCLPGIAAGESVESAARRPTTLMGG